MVPSLLLSLVVLSVGVTSLEVSPALLNRLAVLEKENAAKEERIKQLEDGQCGPSLNARDTPNDALDGPIAFTAYLQADLDNVGKRDAMVFDAVLHNAGGAYDNTTGIFTAPVEGVYFFNFFVGQKDDNQINVMLTVNDVNYVDAYAEGIALNHNDQGGNAAVVHLNAGDRVQVKHRVVGTHVEGSTFLRLSTFSGFLVYPTDTSSVVPIIG